MGKNKIDLTEYIKRGEELSFSKRVRLVLMLSIPSIMAQISSIIMQYIDAAMVGRLGADGSAAIGLVSTTCWMFGSLAYALTIGYSVQVAHAIGAGKKEKTKCIVGQALFAVLMWAVFLMFAGTFLSGSLPRLLGADPRIHQNASDYFFIYAAFLPVAALNSLASGILQCSGNMKTPGILNSLKCFLDILFNAFFIFPSHVLYMGKVKIVLPGLHMGVAGAALGTAAAELFVAVVLFYCVWIKKFSLHKMHIRKDCFRKGYLRKAIKISLPVGFEHFVVCAAQITSTKIVAPLGIVAIAANSFGITAEALCYMPGYGIADAATTLVGQGIGAKKENVAKYFAKISTMIGMVLMSAMAVIIFFAAPYIMAMLSADAKVVALGTKILRIEMFAEPMYAASIVASGALRGAGDTFVPSLMNFGSIWLVRMPLSYLLSLSVGLRGMWFAMCIELIFRGSIFLYRLFKVRWWEKAKNRIQ